MMIRIKIIAFICLSVSCSSTDTLTVSKIKRGTILTKVDNTAAAPLILTYYETNKGEKGIVQIEKHRLSIKPVGNFSKRPINPVYTTSGNSPVIGEDTKKWYIPYEFEYSKLLEKLRNDIGVKPTFTERIDHRQNKNNFLIGKKFVYYQNTSKLRALSIPLKWRTPVNDSPYQLTTGVNVGLGYTFEETRKTYMPVSTPSSNESPFGHLETSYSYGISPFGGFSAIELSPDNTEGLVEIKYNTLAFTAGMLVSVGFNALDIGIAVGFDFPFGDDAKNWVYQNRMWIGAGIGIDLVK